MIELHNISKTFNAKSATEVVALKNISVTINQNDFVVVVGANGSGKSTLLNSIAGSFFVDEGRIIIDKKDITKLSDYNRARYLSRVFQNPLQGTAPDLTIIENFRLAALRTRSKKLQIGTNASFIQHIKATVSTLGMGLENKLHQPMGTLSGGQRQALTLLMSVVDDSKILLLDEPTAALDPRSAEVVMQTANQLITQKSLTAIFITHNLKEAVQYGNRIIQMSEGKIIRDIKADEKSKLRAADVFSWF